VRIFELDFKPIKEIKSAAEWLEISRKDAWRLIDRWF